MAIKGFTNAEWDSMVSAFEEKEGLIGYRKVAEISGISERRTRRFMKIYRAMTKEDKEHIEADVLTEENLKLQAQKQKLQDKNRINNKQVREIGRFSNAMEDYSKAIVEALDQVDVSSYTRVYSDNNNDAVGLIHLSDAHFNELVALQHNKYDFNVAAKRFKMLADKSIRFLRALNVQNVVVANTGDSMNSDRRLDEKLNMATNRGNATVLAFLIIEQFLIYVNKAGFNVTYATVSGNESRVADEWGWSTVMATDNYDFTIYNMLKYHMRNCDGINFIDGDPTELVINIAGKNILMLHGNNSLLKNNSGMEKGVQGIIGKYAKTKTLIDFIISGHLHSTYNSDWFSRASSMVGDNDYSFKDLQLVGRAAQNLHIFYKDGNRDSIKIDLQDCEGIEGFNIVKELEAYNAKSHAKTRKNDVIFKVVI